MMGRVELRQLTYFIAVAEEHHFTRAAERVHVAQPAVSHQVRRLERELGEDLIARRPAGAELTDAGRVFLPHARAALAATRSGRDAIAALRKLVIGRLAIGTVLPAPAQLTALLGDYRRAHPGVELRLREGHTTELLASLAQGGLDLAIVGVERQQAVGADLNSELISTEPVVLAVHRGHRLAERRAATLTQLRDEELVTLPRGSGQRSMLEAACQTAGFAPRITAETGDLAMLIDLAAQGVGAALVPRSVALGAPALAVIPITRPRLVRHTLLCWREETLSPAARVFLADARAWLRATSARR